MQTADAVMDLAKRRGFLWPSYEIYGGLAGFYDYGPLGAAMKARFESLWRHFFLQRCAVPMVEIATPRVTPHEVLKASGHVDQFTDLVTMCANGHPCRADHLVDAAGYEGTADSLSAEEIDAQIAALKPVCPVCQDPTFTAARPINLMFHTEIGPGSGRTGYLRPETAQGIFTDFPHLLRHMRGRLPFGVVQVGGSNRNEISPRQGMLRLREFHMLEAEVFFEDTEAPFADFEAMRDRMARFVPNGSGKAVETTFGGAVTDGLVGNEALAYFLALTQEFLEAAGVDPARLRFRQHLEDEMAHYASDCWDAEFESEKYGWVECVGVADRGCYDLAQHAQHSGRRSDFQVDAPLSRPGAFEAAKHVPVMGVLGKQFKQDAKEVAAAIERLFDDRLATWAGEAGIDPEWLEEGLIVQGPKDARPADGPLSVRLRDGRRAEVPAEGHQVIEGTWTVTGRKLIPRVIEPSFGVDRILWALWEHAYERTEKEGQPYTRLRLSPHVAPIQAAVLPLTNHDTLVEAAQRIEDGLRRSGVMTSFDTSGNIGRRYARQDEVGTPVCITIDADTPQDGQVTLRDRDSTEQKRIPITAILSEIARRFRL